MIEIDPLERPSLAQRVAVGIHQAILTGGYGPGAQLPQQRELATRYGVSMAVIRESLALLASIGLIRSRHGHGTYVTDRPLGLLRYPIWVAPPADQDELIEATEARTIIEESLTGLAAARRTPTDLDRMQRALDDMEAAGTNGELLAAADLQFHLAVADAAHNRPLASALAGLRELVYSHMVRQQQRRITEGTTQDSLDSHRGVFDAVAAGDAVAAQAEIAEILRRAKGGLNDNSSEAAI